MSLSEDRKNFVTASQAHRVMAGFELELEGLHMEKPACDEGVFNGIKKMVELLGRKPKVGEMVSVDLVVPGELINEVFNYIKATTPVFSDGMESVAREIAMASFIKNTIEEGSITADMERGNLQEGEAVAALSAFLDVEFLNTELDQIFLSDGCLGFTPDGVEYDGFNIKSCAEVKNPKAITHMKYLQLLWNQNDLLRVCPVYYWQAQCGLSVSGAEIYHWASYHNDFAYAGYENESKLIYVPVHPVDDHIRILKARADRVLARAPVIVDEILDNIRLID